MNDKEYTFAKATDFTGEEKFDIVLQYIKWCAKLQYAKMISSDNNNRDVRIKEAATMATLTALLECFSDNDHIIRCVTELQIAQEDPLWYLNLPDLTK